MVAQMQMNRMDSKTAYSDGVSVDHKGAELSAQNGAAPDFAGTLVQVLNNQTGAVQETGVLPSGVGNLMSGLLFTYMNQSTETSSDEKALNDLLDLLQSDDPSSLQMLMQNPQFVGWMNEVALALQQMNTGPLTKQDSFKIGETFASADSATESGVNGFLQQNVIQVLKQLQSAMAQAPQNGEIKALLARLQDMNFPDLAKGQQDSKLSGTANVQSTMSTDNPVQSAADQKAPVHYAKPIHPVHLILSQAGYYHPNVNGSIGETTIQNSGEPQTEASMGNTSAVPVMELAKGTTLSSPAKSEMPQITARNNGAPQTEASMGNTSTVPVMELVKGTTLSSPAKSEMPQITADQFAQEMSRFMLKNVKISSLNGISQAKISLYPEHLGQLEVNISVHNGQIVAQFLTDTAKAKELIEGQLAQLRSTLQNQGLQVDKLEVSHNQQTFSGMFQEHRQQRSTEQFLRKNQNRQKYDDDLMAFSVELENAAQIKNLVSGSSFNATA